MQDADTDADVSADVYVALMRLIYFISETERPINWTSWRALSSKDEKAWSEHEAVI